MRGSDEGGVFAMGVDNCVGKRKGFTRGLIGGGIHGRLYSPIGSSFVLFIYICAQN
jgi:hypothetical protein